MKYIGVLCAILMVCCFVVTGCGSEQTDSVNFKVPVDVEPNVSEESAVNDERPAVEGHVGETSAVGNLEIKVFEWSKKDKIDTLEPEEPNNIYIIADVEVINNGNNPVKSNFRDFSIRTPEGYEYRAFDYSGYSPRYPDTAIDPGEKSRGGITVEVPRDALSMYLEFSSPEGRAKIALQ